MEIIYLITGFLLGGIVIFLYLKTKLVPKNDLTQANELLKQAQIELSSRPTKEILSNGGEELMINIKESLKKDE